LTGTPPALCQFIIRPVVHLSDTFVTHLVVDHSHGDIGVCIGVREQGPHMFQKVIRIFVVHYDMYSGVAGHGILFQ